ncbi:MAG: hypothetical protein JRD01_10175 [Deltaproteobacteria bacterium]|nr:hypothetical protein [Deltaproteobacteria bacterium]
MNIKTDQPDIKKSVPPDQSLKARGTSKNITSLGLCLGASTVSIVQLEQDQNLREGIPTQEPLPPRLVNYWLYPHEGDPKRTLVSALKNLDMDSFDRIAATGRKFRKFVTLSSIPEPQAVEYAYGFVKSPDVSCPTF